MKRTKKIRVFALISCVLVLLLSVPTFANPHFTESANGDEFVMSDPGHGSTTSVGVDYLGMPFLSLDMAVGGQSEQGYFRLPWYVPAKYQSQDFIVAYEHSFDIRITTSKQYIYVPNSALTIVFQPSELDANYQCMWTMDFRVADGILYEIDPRNGDWHFVDSGAFVMAFKIGTASYNNSSATSLLGFEPYRNGFATVDSFGDDVTIQRAVLSSCKVGNTTYYFGSTSSLSFDFKLPFGSVDEMTALNFVYENFSVRIAQLLYMVSFDLDSFTPTVGGGYAWKFRFSEQFAQHMYTNGYNVGYVAGTKLGSSDAYDSGYNEGVKDGYHNGYGVGKAEGLEAADVGKFGHLFSGIFNGIYGVFHSIVGFEIPIGNSSINFQHIVGAIIGLLVVGFIVSLFMKTKE